MKPNCSHHNPDPRYLRGLIEQSGISQRKTAQLVGMSWTGFKNYLRTESDPLYRVAPYAVQFAVECLADCKKPLDAPPICDNNTAHADANRYGRQR